jgi:hypothetical protein
MGTDEDMPTQTLLMKRVVIRMVRYPILLQGHAAQYPKLNSPGQQQRQ